MNALYAFVERCEAETAQAKALVLPLLETIDPEVPWTAPNLRALHSVRHDYDPVVARALEHLFRFALPLLEEEGHLGGAEFEQFEHAMSAFEERFWSAQFALSRPPAPPRDYLCGLHALDELEVRRLARQGVFEVDTLAAALGTSSNCPTCKRALQRVVLEELRTAKASARASA